MKSKTLVSVLAIALAAALIGGATMALFTDQATVKEEIFTAGKLKVGVGTQTFAEGIEFGNMRPGDVIAGTFKVENIASLPLCYRAKAVSAGDLFEGNNPAIVDIYANQYGQLAAEGEATVYYNVTLPLAAGNEYMESVGKLSFIVDAVQSNHIDCAEYWSSFVQVKDFDFMRLGGISLGGGLWEAYGLNIYNAIDENDDPLQGNWEVVVWYNQELNPDGFWKGDITFADGSAESFDAEGVLYGYVSSNVTIKIGDVIKSEH